MSGPYACACSGAAFEDQADDPLTPSERAPISPQYQGMCLAHQPGSGGGGNCELPVHHTGPHRDHGSEWPAKTRRETAGASMPAAVAGLYEVVPVVRYTIADGNEVLAECSSQADAEQIAAAMRAFHGPDLEREVRLQTARADHYKAEVGRLRSEGRARLDADGTAKPLTEIVAVMPADSAGAGTCLAHAEQSTHYVVRPVEVDSTAERLERLGFEPLPRHRRDPLVRPGKSPTEKT